MVLFVCYMDQYNKYMEKYGFLGGFFIEKRVYNNKRLVEVEEVVQGVDDVVLCKFLDCLVQLRVFGRGNIKVDDY